MEVFIKDFFSTCDQIDWKLWIWSYLLKKSLIENFNFCAMVVVIVITLRRENYRKSYGITHPELP